MGQGRLPGLKLGLPVPQHLPEGLPKLLPLTSWGGLLNLLPLLAVTSATKAPCGPCVSRGFTTWSFKMLIVSDKDVSYLEATLLETHLLKQIPSSGHSPEPQNAICSQRGRRQNKQQRVTRQDTRKGLSFTVTAPHPALG